MPRLAAGRARVLGVPTRGTTNPNRLRRCDRWLSLNPMVRNALGQDALVIDLGFGASPVTTVELAVRLGPGVRVLGLELDAARVAAAVAAAPHLEFAHGGFEFAGKRPNLVRAFNVLRQYPEPAAAQAWATMCARLAPDGLIVDGTCDEIGRRCCWVTLDAAGPRALTLACHTRSIARPSDLAPRLPKALIHHNVPGEPINALLTELDSCWDTCAVFAPFGQRARWTEAVRMLAGRGWPLLDRWPDWRRGELTVPWSAVAPT